ncbi:heme binding [Homalodisca vitripennis]|nr:heme binding [Homalodisca vitripennis]
MKKCNARGSAARDPHGIKQITVGPPHGIKQITMFIRENVECLDSSFTTTTTIKERAREEVKSVLGETDRDPTYQDLLNLRYLEQVIKETLRLYPAVPYIGRKLFQDLTLPCKI